MQLYAVGCRLLDGVDTKQRHVNEEIIVTHANPENRFEYRTTEHMPMPAMSFYDKVETEQE